MQNSPNLKLVNLLIDARRGIKEKNDLKVIQLLHLYDKQIQLVFTKADKVKLKEGFEEEVKNYLASLGYLLCNVVLSSSKNGVGAKELQLSFGAIRQIIRKMYLLRY